MLVQSANPSFLRRIMQWWFEWSNPPRPPVGATFEQREEARRSYAASWLLLLLSVMILFVLPVAFFRAIFLGNILFLLVTVAMQFVIFSLGWFNRRGLTGVVAFSLMATITFSTLILILGKHGGIVQGDLPLFDNLSGSLLLAVMLLPLRNIFITAIVNLLLMLISLYLFASPALTSVLHTSFISVIYHFANEEAWVAIICWLWGTSMIQALKRADRAEEIVKLEQTISIQNREALEEKRQLEEAIQSLIETHTAVANGNYSARVPINKENVLWPLAGALNNLLSRIQIWRRDSLEMAQLRIAVTQLTSEASDARKAGVPMTFSHTGTMLDPLLTQLQRLQQVSYTDTEKTPRIKVEDSSITPVPAVSRLSSVKRKLQSF
jgi:HAMP domain-containing protein